MSKLQVIELRGKRVLTTSQLAESYETETDNVVKNFNRNKDKYTEGKHFFLLEGQDLKDFRAKGQIDLPRNINKFYVWTEKGSWLHAKSLNTDAAWDAYELLVDEYYRITTTTNKELSSNELTAMLAVKLNEDLNEVKEEVKAISDKLDNRMTIDYAQQQVLLNIKNKRVEELHSDSYFDVDRRKLHANAWSTYKKAFRVASYKDTLQKDFNEAAKWLENWRPLL